MGRRRSIDVARAGCSGPQPSAGRFADDRLDFRNRNERCNLHPDLQARKMSKSRRVSLKNQKRCPLGFKLCLVCDSRLPKGRSSYCSDECCLRNTPQMIRLAVERRDEGVCAGCGCQCRMNPPRHSMSRKEIGSLPEWQADHVVPVAEGGGLCGLDGYRTLCLPCHNRETAALAARLATARKPKPVEIGLFSGVGVF